MDRKHVKQLWRAALDMHERLARRNQLTAQLVLPRDQWRRCRRQLVRLARLHDRGWQRSLALVEPEVARELRTMKVQLDALATEVAQLADPRPIPSAAHLFQDLVALEEEFGEIQIGFEESTLTVVTEGIELADQDLGPFGIELKWSAFDRPGQAYRIHALEAIDDEVPHPHVRNEVLCEGDAAEPIAVALEQGRIFDFFMVVRQVLRNYNPDSAFDGFNDSDRIACIDCGYRASDDERSWCQGCDNDVCDVCSRLCDSCGVIRCHGCVETCTVCNEHICRACQKTCAMCEEPCCERCFTDDAECKNCRERKHGKRRPQRKIQRPPAVSLRFSPYAWAKLLFLRDVGETEVGGFGRSLAEDLLFVEDVQLVRQNCSWSSVEFEDGAVADYFDRMAEEGVPPEACGRVWIHTHPGSSAMPSNTDEATFARVFGRNEWAVMFILAQNGSTSARLQFSAGPGGSIELPVSVDYGQRFPATDPESWLQEYHACVRPADLPAKPQKSEDERPWWDEYDWFYDARNDAPLASSTSYGQTEWESYDRDLYGDFY